VLLLRRAVFGLRRAGHEVTLLAPERPGSALVGPGPAEAHGLIPWDRADVSALLAGGPLPAGDLRDRLAAFGAALVYSRQAELVTSLESLIPRVVAGDPLPPPGRHAGAFYARVLERLEVAPPDDPEIPPLQPTPAEADAVGPSRGRLPPDFLALHPGSGSPAKSWPAARFAELAEQLAWPRPLLAVGGPADAEVLLPLRSREDVVVVDDLAPRPLGALLAGAGLFVGNDSGVTHTAAAWGAPVLALFGPTDPAVWAPEGRRVKTLRAADRRMESLSVAEVMNFIRPGMER
jgi:glycosyl transferase family 9 (putative heptosyltransferase)